LFPLLRVVILPETGRFIAPDAAFDRFFSAKKVPDCNSLSEKAHHCLP
jgi:hypothetical protein